MIDHNPYMRPSHPSDVTKIDSLLYFVFEREAIRLARKNELPREQWTADPVFRKYKFTNIRRRDDRVSQWVITRLIEPAVDNGDEHLWFTLVIARLINWPPTLSRLIESGVIPCLPEEFDAVKFVKTIEQFKSAGNKAYSGAYMLYPTKMDPGGNKSQAVAKHIIGDVVRRAESVSEALWGKAEDGVYSVRDVVDALSECFGISTFMAGQVAADLTYTDLNFVDLYTWAPLGPGSQLGLNILFDKSRYHKWSQVEFNRALIGIRDQIVNSLDITDLTLHDVQNVMCEYSKYAGFLRDGKHPKNSYKPETEF